MKRSLLFFSLVLLLLLVVVGIPAAASPTVTGVSPSSGPNNGDITVTITGTGFNSQSTTWISSVSTGGIAYGTVTTLSDTSLTATFPLNRLKVGMYAVYVNTPYTDIAGGYHAKDDGYLEDAFTVYASTPTTTTTTTTPIPTYPPFSGGGFSVSSISVDPAVSQTPGTPVIVTYDIGLSGSGSETFPSTNELQMLTDLDDAKWSYSLVLDGVDTPQPTQTGQILSLSGWILAYPSTIDESLRITLEGYAPSTTNPLLVKIQKVDIHNNVIDPVYELRGRNELILRTLPTTVNPGSQFTVGINPNQSFRSDPWWKVLESIPYGFSYVSSTTFYTIQTSPNSFQFIQNSNTAISYILRAPSTEGPFIFSGTFTDADKNTGNVDGDTVVNMWTAYQNYRNATTGKIEQVDARRAMTDNLDRILSNQGAGSVLENYFLGL